MLISIKNVAGKSILSIFHFSNSKEDDEEKYTEAEDKYFFSHISSYLISKCVVESHDGLKYDVRIEKYSFAIYDDYANR